MIQPRLKRWLFIIAIPLLYALLLRFFFGVQEWQQLFSVMSITFLLCLPTIVRALTVYFSNEVYAKQRRYQLLAPWIPIVLFFLITLALSIEGWVCWIMVLPLFLLAASLGGVIGGGLKTRKKKKTLVSVLVFLPFLMAPAEQWIGAIPGTYKAYTWIDINAPAEKIWPQVTRVATISEAEDKRGWLTRFLHFPRPVEAVLNYEGVGAYREARFTGGLLFHETVLEYVHQQKMVFSIKAYPHEIPSTTLDQHVVVGGRFFEVLTGTYELERLSGNLYRLHLYSYFKMNTTFNFYASWWARWIMKDIQNNILRVEKQRAELQ